MTSSTEKGTYQVPDDPKECLQSDIVEFFERHDSQIQWGSHATSYTYQLHIRLESENIQLISATISKIKRFIVDAGGICVHYGNSLTGYRNMLTGYFDQGAEEMIHVAALVSGAFSGKVPYFMSSSYGGTRIYLQKSAADHFLIHNLEEKKLRQFANFAERSAAQYVMTPSIIKKLLEGVSYQDHFRLIGNVDVGLEEPLEVFEFFRCVFSKENILKFKTKTEFEEAVSLFVKGRYAEAGVLFESCYRANSADAISKKYLSHCQQSNPAPRLERRVARESAYS